MKKMNKVRRSFCRFVLPAVALVAILALAAPASAQAIIKVNDNVNFKFGILLQGWADWQQLNVGAVGASTGTAGATDGYQQNLFVRRMRLLMGGQVAKDVTFFVETDNPNLGKSAGATAKALGSGFILQDAFVEWKIANEFMIDGGLILIPLCRNCNESAASQLTLDYGSFSFLESTPTASSVGRDTGFQAKGYLFGNHLEYRAGAYQGFRQSGSRNAFRFAGRLMYNFLDPEVGAFYPGTYLGKKKVFAIGASVDTQNDYKAFGFDGFLDLPVGKGNGFTLEGDFVKYDGGVTFTALPKQDTFMGQVGFFFGGAKLMPFFRYENQSLNNATLAKAGNSRNIQAGMTWYPYGHNFNIRAAYTSREKPDSTTPKLETTSEFTLQIQLFYF
jgi:hypothetical protein